MNNKEIIFVDSVIDCSRLCQLGYDNVIPVFQALNSEHLEFLKRYKPQKVYVAAENRNILAQLTKLDLSCFKVKIPEELTKENFIKALNESEPVASKIGEGTVRIIDELLKFEFGNRKYEIRELNGIDPYRMKINIKAQNGGTTFHIDTIDLYIGRSRSGFVNRVAQLFKVAQEVIESDLCTIINKLEKVRETKDLTQEQDKGYHMTQDEEDEAIEFLKSPDLLNQVVQHLDILGYVGEDTNKKIGYLITISRKLNNPLSGVIISRSGAGKSKLMEYLADLVPQEDIIVYTRLTPQALYYQDKNSLKHKLLIAGEEEGIFGSNYPLRELISSKKLKLGAPIKDTISGKMKTVEYEVEGPIALLFSTTQPAINYENATRCFTLSLDENREQTRKILQSQRHRDTLEGIDNVLQENDIKRMHQNAQRLLKKVMIVNPYADSLTFPDKWLEVRREQEKYLSLIRTIAFLHQHQREHKAINRNGMQTEYIEATLQDIEQANTLMTQAIGTTIGDLSRPSRELLGFIREMVDKKCKEEDINPKDYRFNRRDVREYTGWSDSQIKAHIKQLEDLQYLLISKGERGKMYRYELQYEGSQDSRYFSGLLDTKKLAQKSESLIKDCKSLA